MITIARAQLIFLMACAAICGLGIGIWLSTPVPNPNGAPVAHQGQP